MNRIVAAVAEWVRHRPHLVLFYRVLTLLPDSS